MPLWLLGVGLVGLVVWWASQAAAQPSQPPGPTASTATWPAVLGSPSYTAMSIPAWPGQSWSLQPPTGGSWTSLVSSSGATFSVSGSQVSGPWSYAGYPFTLTASWIDPTGTPQVTTVSIGAGQ